MDLGTSHFGKMKLWPVEHRLNIFEHFFNIFIIKIRFSLSNVLIKGESNFDDKFVEKSVQLVRSSSFRNDWLVNPFLSQYRTMQLCKYLLAWKVNSKKIWVNAGKKSMFWQKTPYMCNLCVKKEEKHYLYASNHTGFSIHCKYIQRELGHT